MAIKLALLAIVLCGCTTREVVYQGVTYRHRSFATTQSFGKLHISTPGGASVEVENYSNDQVGAIRELKETIREINNLKK